MEVTPNTSPQSRDRFIDAVRGVSLVVVVIWHWSFTILRWEADGPHATSPLGFTKGMWIITWVMQVMPLFFFVGGWANLQAYQRAQARGVTTRKFVTSRLSQLLMPAFVLIGAWWAILLGVGALVELKWLAKTVILVLSPLWFAFSYAIVIALFPLFKKLHDRYSYLVIVWLAGCAALVDIARFAHHVQYIGWLNMIIVWGLAHQIGFFYKDLRDAPRRVHQVMAYGGAFFLIALVWSRIYPGSMVGVPGDKFSNMAPPSLAIVALVGLQCGLLLLIRPWVEARLERARWKRFVELMSTYSMPLYLLHTSGLAVFLIGGYLLNHRKPLEASVSWEWWAYRPLAILLPLCVTLPLLWLIGLLGKLSRRAAREAVEFVADAAEKVENVARNVADRLD